MYSYTSYRALAREIKNQRAREVVGKQINHLHTLREVFYTKV
ncbi:MAG TPA: hypothetical protein V6C71_16285 [Coleofasciculaceae cyanobacterium]